MSIRNFFMLLVVFLINTQASEVIKDPLFKKFDKHWWLKPHKEYQQYKYKIKRGVFSVETKHTSEYYYYGLVSPVDLEAGKKYKLTFEMKCEGDGVVNVYARTSKDRINNRKLKRGSKFIVLGLAQKIDKPAAEWKRYSCEFTALPNPNSDQVASIKILLGEYLGEMSIRKMSLKENPEGESGGKKGKLTVSAVK